MKWAMTVAAVVGLLSLGATAHAAYPGRNGRLAFGSTRGGLASPDVFTVRRDGTGWRRLTHNYDTFDACAAWSPDGRMITYCSTRSGNFDVWVMRADGSHKRRITFSSADDFFPEFSPDGRRIAFMSNRSGNFDIWIVDLDRTRIRRFTWSRADDAVPVWRPTGGQIAFASTRSGNDDIYVKNLVGTRLRRVTRSPAADFAPDWSPNGRLLAFDSDRSGTVDIYKVRPDGSGLTRVTRTATIDIGPAWSPNGRKLVFSRAGEGEDREIVTINYDGTNARAVTHNRANENAASWQPLPR